MIYKRLGEMLVASETITEDQLRKALDMAAIRRILEEEMGR